MLHPKAVQGSPKHLQKVPRLLGTSHPSHQGATCPAGRVQPAPSTSSKRVAAFLLRAKQGPGGTSSTMQGCKGNSGPSSAPRTLGSSAVPLQRDLCHVCATLGACSRGTQQSNAGIWQGRKSYKPTHSGSELGMVKIKPFLPLFLPDEP